MYVGYWIRITVEDQDSVTIEVVQQKLQDFLTIVENIALNAVKEWILALVFRSNNFLFINFSQHTFFISIVYDYVPIKMPIFYLVSFKVLTSSLSFRSKVVCKNRFCFKQETTHISSGAFLLRSYFHCRLRMVYSLL